MMGLKVGEFSRLCQVPVKTLRYYDEIGLFIPAETDRFTNYRYYMLDQLPTIHRIMALKELGLSLDQISQLLNANLSTDEIHNMFMAKLEEVQKHVEEELTRLALVKFHLRQIEQESRLPELQVAVKKLEPFLALTFRKIFPAQADIDLVGHEILRAVTSGELKAVATPMGIVYAEEFKRYELDYEFVLPTEHPILPVSLRTSDTLTIREVSGVELAATYMHFGDYDGLNEAQVRLQCWAVENGYTLGNEMRMVYFRGPMHRVAPEAYLTELQHQITRA